MSDRSKMLRLPWRGRWAPHALLDVGRLCDIHCPGCYNTRDGGFKSLHEIEDELAELLRRRRLQTVTLSGGEPTLHPDLPSIVATAFRHHLKVALLTNGQNLDHSLLQKLADAGLSIVMLHIQPGQRRGDIPGDAPSTAWQQLRADKARLVKQCGIEVGLTWIARKSRLAELASATEEVLASPDLHYLLVTGYRNFARFCGVSGSIEGGLRMLQSNPADGERDEVTMRDFDPIMKQHALLPFGYIASSRNPHAARWLTSLVAVRRKGDGRAIYSSLKVSWADRLLVRSSRWVAGRQMFLFRPAPWQFSLQLVLNALTGGWTKDTIRLLASVFSGGRLVDKHLVLQEGPTILENGEIEFCEDCPDAVWRRGQLVPVCLADRMCASF